MHNESHGNPDDALPLAPPTAKQSTAATSNRRDFMQLVAAAGPAMLFTASAGTATPAAAAPAGAAAATRVIPDEVFVIDAVAHRYNVSKPNILQSVTRSKHWLGLSTRRTRDLERS